jgi:hypothetical protein
MDGPTYESTHQLLLGLAGHVDDDLLSWVRELVAVGEEARAVSLVTADVVAERIQLPAPVRAALVEAGRTARAGIDPVELAPAAEPSVEHRFAAAPAGAGDVASAIRALPARQLQGAAVHLAWRLTPAGTAPGPLPHPVVILEIDPVRHSGEMLSYLVASGLARGGVHASVEVVAAGQAHPPYQSAALAAAVPVAVGDSGESGGVPTVESPVVPEPVTEAVPTVTVESAAVTEPVRVVQAIPLADIEPADDAVQDDEPEYAEEPAEAEHEELGDIADEDPAVDEPEPVLDPSEPHPFADIRTDARPTPQPDRPRRRPVAGAPALAALSDPLSGPLSEPLMAPLLDPTIHAHDPLGVDHLVGPSRHTLAAVGSETPEEEPQESPAEAAEPVAEAAPEPAAEPHLESVPEPELLAEDSWAAEWESGAWAMPLDDVEATPADEAAGAGSEPPARHGLDQHDEPPAALEPPRQLRAPRPAPVQPERRSERQEPPAPRSGEPRPARPEPTRLSDADRELLARLQAELVQGRKPRRSGAPAGGRPGSNGRGPNRRDTNPPEAG